MSLTGLPVHFFPPCLHQVKGIIAVKPVVFLGIGQPDRDCPGKDRGCDDQGVGKQFRRVQRIEWGVQYLVEDVVGGGNQAGGSQGEQRIENEPRRQHQCDNVPKEDEDVLQPVVDSADLEIFNQNGFRITQGGSAD